MSQVDVRSISSRTDLRDVAIRSQSQVDVRSISSRTTTDSVNISHYLDVESLSKLLDQVKNTSLELLLIEFSDVERRKFFEKCQYIYIDRDFMDSRELID